MNYIKRVREIKSEKDKKRHYKKNVKIFLLI